MSTNENIKTLNQIFQTIFQKPLPWNLKTFCEKFTFDIKLPSLVRDSITEEATYSAMPNAKSFMTTASVQRRENWLLPKRIPHSIDEIIAIWESVNYIATERVTNSENVSASDPIYNSTNVHASTNCGDCDHILFCDGTYESNYAAACQRSTNLSYCLRVDDSAACTNSYNVICSNKISNSYFIQDASNLYECMFCSHLAHCQFCIANMQFTEAEYYRLKTEITKWILQT